jgi:tRNA-dihydrouridine synthase C
MEGITVGSFCRVLAKRGLVRCWISPFIRLTTGVPRLSRLRHRLAPYLDTGLPLVAQIMGLDIDLLVATAQRLTSLGIVGIDLNCGCPSKTVVGNGAGGALLQRPQWIHDALVALRHACPDVGISVKLRAGFESPGEMPGILAAVRAAGPDFCILHFRTVSEQYAKVPEGWGRLAKARDLLPDIPLIASGDLFTPDNALQVWRACGVDGVAPARGMLRNPCLLQDIERVCRGEPLCSADPAVFIALLTDVATDANHAPDSHHGFVVELASHILGRKSEAFQRLVACRNLGAAIELLRRLASVEHS